MSIAKTIFHIDDDDEDRLFFQEAISHFPNTQCRSFSSFDAALKGIVESAPQLIYMDFWVPGMTAPQFLKHVVAISGHSYKFRILSGTEVPYFFRELLDSYEVTYHIKDARPAALRNLLQNDLAQ